LEEKSSKLGIGAYFRFNIEMNHGKKFYVIVERVEAWWSSVLILEVLCVKYKLKGGILLCVVSSITLPVISLHVG